MLLLDRFAATALCGVIITACYSVYFLPQRHSFRPARGLMSRIDHWVPFRPQWVWVYSFLYYPFITAVVLVLDSWWHFIAAGLSYVALLIVQVALAFAFPVRTPAEWRAYEKRRLSERYLGFVQSIDKGGNAFPSMHVAVVTLTAFHLSAGMAGAPVWLFAAVWAMPVLVSLSALYVKQHYFWDLPPGMALGALVYGGFWLAY